MATLAVALTTPFMPATPVLAAPDEVTYYFNSDGGPIGKKGSWVTPEYFVDNILTNFSYTAADGDTQLLDGNTCPATDLGTITKVELRAYGYGDGNDRIDLTPIFVAGNGNEHPTTPGTVAGWGAYVDITNDPNHPDWSAWSHIQTIDVHVEKDTVAGGATMYCSKVEIRVTYWAPPVADIDVGADPLDRGSGFLPGGTLVDKNNPANASGTLHTVLVWVGFSMTDLRVGTFYTTNGNTLKCRDSAVIGAVAAGAERTFTEDSESNPLAITVVEGDYIGCYYTDGKIEWDAIGFAGIWIIDSEYIDPGDEVEYTSYPGDAISLYGYGDIVGIDPPTVTTQAVTDIEATTATGNGNITDVGGENCDKRGMVYGTTSKGNPGDVAPPGGYDGYEEETDSFGVGAFTRALTGLTPNETYYVRAYAHNADGYSYGSEVEFDTERRKNMLYALLAISVALTWAMFQTRNMMLGFPCVIFWAIMGGHCYTLSTETWDTYYLLFFASFGMAIFCALAMFALRSKKEEKEEGDEFIDEGKDDIRYIDEGSPSEGDNPKESEVSKQTKGVRGRAKGRREKASRRMR